MLTQPQETYREVLQVADNLYRQDPDWVTFFREVLGIDGIVRNRFPSFDELSKFEQSEEFERIQRMLVKLREKRISTDADNEPTRVITVRLPKSMHEYLRTEAHDLRTSMNKLCISKLLQVIGEEMIPNERTTGGQASTVAPPQNRPIINQPVNSQPLNPTSAPAYSAQNGLSTAPSQQASTIPFKSSQPRF